MKIKTMLIGGALAGAFAVSSVAGAAVIFDADTGEGFVGKGDVQLAFGWNNKALQENLSDVQFTYNASTTETSEISWVCTNSNNENLQERERTTTTTSSTVGVVSKVARVRNQITGVELSGYNGTPTVIEGNPVTEGPAVNSCPSGPWTLTTPAGDPVQLDPVTAGGLYASYDGGTPVLLP
jgi:hypothetical protein